MPRRIPTISFDDLWYWTKVTFKVIGYIAVFAFSMLSVLILLLILQWIWT